MARKLLLKPAGKADTLRLVLTTDSAEGLTLEVGNRRAELLSVQHAK